jgi:hypothetical protein
MSRRWRVALWLGVCLVSAGALSVGARPDVQTRVRPPERALSGPALEAGRATSYAALAERTVQDHEPETPYIEGQYLVAPPEGHTLAWVAAQAGGEVVMPEGASGYGIVATADPDALLAVGARPSPLGRIVGTGRTISAKANTAPSSSLTSTTTPAPAPKVPTPWHLDNLAVPQDNVSWSGWRVAVLDSGVAYETQGRFVRAPGLAGVSWVAPLDLIELDGHPNDDHQHGTHIASLIASQGTYRGVVPGVSLVPVKVLDATNRGNEWALVEGIHHAIDQGADVINLSLSFPLGYAPSTALLDALARAWEQDVVVVAAAGNDGARELTWPAASRLVVAVGAAGTNVYDWNTQSTYTNRSPKLDILAPGGSLSEDRNGDGFVDGILAETIDPLDPARIGLWFYQGSSQATALVSGLAVRLMAAGTAPHDVAPTLQQSSGGYDPTDAWLTGTGADYANLAGALAAPRAHRDLYAGLLPYLADMAGKASPRARVTVIDAQGVPVVGATVLGSVYSTSRIEYPTCVTDAAGSCSLQTAGWDNDRRNEASTAWAFRVDAVVEDGVASRPARALWTSEGLAVLLDALSHAVGWDALAVYWPGGDDPVLGKVLESWAVVDTGVGPQLSPLALVFQPSHVASLSTEGSLVLDVDGTGLLSSPLGTTLSLRTLTLDGSGLLSSPLMGSSTTLVGLDGSGLLSSPLGFHATQLYTSGSGLISSPLGYSSSLLLDRGTLLGSTSWSPYFQPLLAGSSSGDVGSALVASGALEVGLSVAPEVTQAQGATSAVLYK